MFNDRKLFGFAAVWQFGRLSREAGDRKIRPRFVSSSLYVARRGKVAVLERVLEPEVMDTVEEAVNYDAMDHAEVNRRFVDDLLAVLAGTELAAAGKTCRLMDLGT